MARLYNPDAAARAPVRLRSSATFLHEWLSLRRAILAGMTLSPPSLK